MQQVKAWRGFDTLMERHIGENSERAPIEWNSIPEQIGYSSSLENEKANSIGTSWKLPNLRDDVDNFVESRNQWAKASVHSYADPQNLWLSVS